MSSSHLQPLLPGPAAGGYALGCGQQAEAGPSTLLSVHYGDCYGDYIRAKWDVGVYLIFI